MSFEAGNDVNVYYIDGAWALTASSWVEIPNIVDSNLPWSEEMAEQANRDQPIKSFKRTYIDLGIEITMEVDRTNAIYQDLVAASIAQTVVPIGSGVSKATGAKLFAFEAMVSMGPETHDNGTTVRRTFLFKPHMNGTNKGADITLTA